MFLDAVVTSADLQKVVDQLTPATVPLGSRGHLFFDAPAEVSLVAGRGLRIRCGAKLKWPVLGIDVAITVSSMTLLIVPAIEFRNGERVIVLAPEVEALDLALLPDIGDAEVRSYINRELQEKRVELPWNYKQTLDHRFFLPDWFRADKTFEIHSDGAALKVTNDAVGLAIHLDASVGSSDLEHASRGPVSRSAPVATSGAAPRSLSFVESPRSRRRWLSVGIAVASGFAIGCLAGWRQVS